MMKEIEQISRLEGSSEIGGFIRILFDKSERGEAYIAEINNIHLMYRIIIT
jgi:hypothetical protein